MKRVALLIILALPFAGGDCFGGGRSVMASQQRLDILDFAREFTTARATTWRGTVDQLADPFFRSRSQRETPKTEKAPSAAELSDQEILHSLAPRIDPSGYFVVGGEPVLLVNGQRLRAGDIVPLNFEGRVYQVAISSIESNSFVLELNGQRVRRELK